MALWLMSPYDKILKNWRESAFRLSRSLESLPIAHQHVSRLFAKISFSVW